MEEERVRYGDADLAEFKQIILKKLEQAKADYELLRSNITHSSDNDTEDTSPTFKVLEEGATTLSKEETGRLAAHQMKFIRNLEMALVRVENKTYGICKTTGKLIPKESVACPSRHGVHRGQRETQIRPESRRRRRCSPTYALARTVRISIQPSENSDGCVLYIDRVKITTYPPKRRFRGARRRTDRGPRAISSLWTWRRAPCGLCRW